MASPSIVLGSLVVLLALVLPVAVGTALILSARRGGPGHPACGECKYDLSGSIGVTDRCPECGSLIAQVGVLPARRARKSWMMWVGIGLICVPLMCAGLGIWSAATFTVRARTAAAQARQAAQQQAAQQQQATASASEQSPDVKSPSGDESE